MSDRSSDSGDFSLCCSFSSVENDKLEVSELDNPPKTIEPYQFEPVASKSDNYIEPDVDIGYGRDTEDEERLHGRNWWEIPCAMDSYITLDNYLYRLIKYNPCRCQCGQCVIIQPQRRQLISSFISKVCQFYS